MYKLAWFIVTRPFRTWGKRPTGAISQVQGEDFIVIPLEDYFRLKKQAGSRITDDETGGI